MSLKRGDVILVRFPHVGGTRAKRRPVVVIQSDAYNSNFRHAVVAEITSNLAAATDPANLLIDVSSAEGQATGLQQNSVVSCLFLATIAEDRLGSIIGTLSSAMLAKLNDCLRVALDVS